MEEENEKLEKYYKFFKENSGVENWSWYKEMQIWTDILQDIKENINNNEIDSLDKFNLYLAEKSNQKIKNSDAFLNRYLFMQDNGTANIGRGRLTNDDRADVRHKTQEDFSLLFNILIETDIENASKSIESLISGRYKAVRFRFLKTLFPENFTSVDAPGKLDKLSNMLNKKLSIRIEGNNHIEKHKWLMDQIEDNDVYKKQIFYWELYYMLDNDLDLKKAIVYYGAPGTGKTYKAKKEAKKFIDGWALKTFTTDKKYLIETVQFHPSYSYEDFIEGIRPSKDKELKLKSGVFKKFCKKVGEIEIKLYKNTDFLEKFKDKDFSDITILDVREIQGIENILPNINNIADGLTLQDIIEPAFFIIDEINRAELSRVFGELMYSLEYRGYNGKIKTQYSYLNEDEHGENIFFWENGEDWFFIPQNVYIIGTMNTIDRSVDSFDFALRRRFMWEEILPNYNVIKVELDRKLPDSKNLGIELSESFLKLNTKIKDEPLLGSDYQIGHSYALNIKHKYFVKVKDAKDFLWQRFLKPLIQEYLRGLGDSKKSNEILESFQKEFRAS